MIRMVGPASGPFQFLGTLITLFPLGSPFPYGPLLAISYIERILNHISSYVYTKKMSGEPKSTAHFVLSLPKRNLPDPA
jgi:hypothetical protein